MDTLVLSASSLPDALHKIWHLKMEDFIGDYYEKTLKRLKSKEEAVQAMMEAAFFYVSEETPEFFPHSIADSEKERLVEDVFSNDSKMYVINIELRDSHGQTRKPSKHLARR